MSYGQSEKGMEFNMEKVLNFVKNNKVKFIIIIIVLIIGIIGIGLLLDYKKKEYNLTQVGEYKYFLLNKNDKYGVIDTKGNIVIEPLYNTVKIPNPEKAVFICENEEKMIVLNHENKEIFSEYEEVDAILINGTVSNLPYEKNALQYKQNGMYGIINYEGKKITKPIYEEIKGLENKESELLVKKHGKYGVINVKGAKLIKEQYDNVVADGFYTNKDKYGLSGYIVSNKTNDGYRYGYVNYKHKKILDAEYNAMDRILEIEDANDIYLIACKNGQYGVIKNDKNIINYSYQGIEYDNINNIFELQRNGKYGVADYNGKVIVPVQYREIEIKGMYLQALKNEEDEYIYFNNVGEEIKDLKYTSVLKTDNDNYYVSINEEGLYGIINKQEEKLVENQYNYLEYLFKDYFIASKDNGYLGVIDVKGNIMVDFKYEVLQKIDDTNVLEAKILRDNKSELYSENLEKIYSIHNAVIYKENNYIKSYSDAETKYFDFNGKELENKEIFVNNKLFASKKEDKWGFIDRDGKIIVDYIYDRVTEFNEYGFAGIKKGDKWGIIGEDGKVIEAPVYKIEEKNIEPEFLGEYYKIYYGYGESYFTDKV